MYLRNFPKSEMKQERMREQGKREGRGEREAWKGRRGKNHLSKSHLWKCKSLAIYFAEY